MEGLTFIKELGSVLRSQCEELAKLILGPFHTMKSLFREHFKCAVRDLCVILRVILGAVALSLVRNDDLHVTLRSQSTTLKEGSPSNDASGIDIATSMDII